MKIVSKEDIINRTKNKFPNQSFEIVDYTRVTKPFTIKCLNCNRVRTFSSFNNFIGANKTNICDCYTKNSNYSLYQDSIKTIEQILDKSKNEVKFLRYWYKEDTRKNMIEVLCLDCNQVYSKPFSEFKKNYKCPFCKGKELLNTQAVKSLLSDEYELLSEYKGTNKKVLVKHLKCGFIWKTTVNSLYRYTGCPKCNKKISKGENRIISFLIKNGIAFEKEKSFKWQSNTRRRYDFYLPDYNLICEYNGEQHYREVDYFKRSLEEQQSTDAEKKKEAEDNGYNYLVIPYYSFNNIETILNNWLNDYSDRKYIVSD